MNVVLLQYLFAAMISWVPISQHAYEPAAKTEARYRAVAEDALEASVDNPIFIDASPPGGGERTYPDGSVRDGAMRTALLTLAWASLESFYVRRIDDCHPLKGESDADKDGNPTAWTLWQMHVESGRTPKVLLCSSRKIAAAAFLAWMKESFARCRSLELGDRGSFYAAGRCERNEKSRHRIRRAIVWAKDHPIPSTPEELASNEKGE